MYDDAIVPLHVIKTNNNQLTIITYFLNVGEFSDIFLNWRSRTKDAVEGQLTAASELYERSFHPV